MSGVFSPRPGGGVTVRLSTSDRSLLEGVVDVLESVGSAADDPAAGRLHVAAHRDDPAAEAEYQELVAPDLATARLTDRSVFRASLERAGTRGTLSGDEAVAWLRVIGDVRLALAARLGIDHDGWEEEAVRDPGRGVIAYLGVLQQDLVEALDTD